jgi:hypothetical protein
MILQVPIWRLPKSVNANDWKPEGVATENHTPVQGHHHQRGNNAAAAGNDVTSFVARRMSPVTKMLSRRSLTTEKTSNASGKSTDGTSGGGGTAAPVANPTTLEEGSDDGNTVSVTDNVVQKTETLLRIVCGLLLAYSLGVRYPNYQWIVNNVGEYSAVAWTTCFVIRVMALWQRSRDGYLYYDDEDNSVVGGEECYNEEEEVEETTPLLFGGADRQLHYHPEEEEPQSPVVE